VTGELPDPRPRAATTTIATMLAAFPALQAQAQGEDTVLAGTLADQAALYGVLAQIEALGLELLEVKRIPSAYEGP
jgi:hypothetical protein